MQRADLFGSVTGWIRQLGKAHSEESATILWHRFQPQLLTFIIRRVRRGARLEVDEDALANAVFHCVIRISRSGKLSDSNRDGFWKLMKTIATRQVIDQRRRETRQRRGGGSVVTESSIREHDAVAHGFLDQFPSKDFPPDLSAMTAEFLGRIMASFGTELRTILNLRLDGHTVEEISRQIQKSKPTVERKLRLIRETLQATFGGEDDVTAST